MKFIKPSEISSKILTLIEESDEFVLLVSPYVKISKWYKLTKKLKELKTRNIPLKFIIRDDSNNTNSSDELNHLGIEYMMIPNLHCKLYMNEKIAIVSSMNMLLSSEINSLELGYQTETLEEYNELKEFCIRYLNVDFNSSEKITVPNIPSYISQNVPGVSSARLIEGSIKIKTRANNYNCSLWYDKNYSKVRISGILSGQEFEFIDTGNFTFPESDYYSAEVQEGGERHYDTIWGTSKSDFNSTSIGSTAEGESWEIAQTIIEFIQMVEEFKKSGISYKK